MNLIAQGNEKFEKMLTMGKVSGDKSGLGYELNNPTPHPPTYANIVKNDFMRSKEKAKVI